MNAYLKKILLIVGIFSVIFLSGFENKTSAEESCTFVPDDFVWSGDNLKDESPTIRDKIYVLTINTSNCKNTPFTLDLNNDDNTFNETVAIKIKNEIKSALTFTAEEDKITLTFKTHEQSCDAHLGPDCQVFLRINQGNILSTKETLKGYHTNNLWTNDKSYLEKGVLFANCRDDGLLAAGAATFSPIAGMILNEGFDVKIGCSDTQWELLKAIGGTIEGFEDFATPIEPINQQFDPESPCFISQEEGYNPNCYELLAPVPGLKGATDPLGNNRWSINLKNFQIGDYVNSLFSIALGILTLLAVIMIVIAGVQYMTIESFQGKSDAKSRITGALTGLLLALSIYIVLGTINPDLLEVNFGSNIEEVALEGYDPPTSPYFSSGSTGSNYNINAGSVPTGSASQYLANSGVYCPKQGGRTVVKQVAESFQEKVSYRYGGRFNDLGQSFPSHWKGSGKGYNKNTSCQVSSGTLCLDCSAFVATVLYCSGITEKPEIGTTTQIFQNSEKINQLDKKNGVVNGVPLQPGDLIGGKGHVGIYIGNGMVAESTSDKGGRNLNKAIKIRGMDGNWFGIGKKGGYVVRLNKLSGVKLN